MLTRLFFLVMIGGIVLAACGSDEATSLHDSNPGGQGDDLYDLGTGSELAEPATLAYDSLHHNVGYFGHDIGHVVAMEAFPGGDVVVAANSVHLWDEYNGEHGVQREEGYDVVARFAEDGTQLWRIEGSVDCRTADLLVDRESRIVLVGHCNGPSRVGWVKKFAGDGTLLSETQLLDVPASVVELPDGTLMIASRLIDQNETRLQHLDGGVSLMRKLLPPAILVYDLVATPSGRIFAAGLYRGLYPRPSNTCCTYEDAWVAELTATGEVIWERRLSDGDHLDPLLRGHRNLWSIAVDTDENLYVHEHESYWKSGPTLGGKLHKLDDTGELIWSRTTSISYQSQSNPNLRSMSDIEHSGSLTVGDGVVYLPSYTIESYLEHVDGLVHAYSTDGENVWRVRWDDGAHWLAGDHESPLGEWFRDIVLLEDGDLLVVGDVMMEEKQKSIWLGRLSP